MDYKQYEGKFAKIIVQKTEAHYGKLKKVEDNLVIFECSNGQILTLSPENIKSIVPNGGE